MAFFGGGTLTFLGHSTFHLTTPGGRRLLLDPWVRSNPVCPEENYDVGPLDLILVTHGHTDHIGDLVPIARETGAKVICTADVADWLAGQGLKNTLTMNMGGTILRDGLRLTMTRADHASRVGDHPGGQAVGFILTLENEVTLYAAGDTGLFGDMALLGQLYAPDFALLPIGDRFTMGPRQAAHACRLLGATHVVPMHYGTFPFLTGTVAAFETELGRLGLRPQVHALRPGETLT